MKASTIRISIFILAVTSLTGFGCSNNQNADTTSSPKNHKISLSTIQLVNLDGTPFKLDALTDQAVFLNIWATWCKPCIAEMPSIEGAYQQLKDADIVFLLASDEQLPQIKNFKNQHSYSFQFVQLKSGLETVQSYALPTTLLFDNQGNLVSTEVGAKIWDNPEEISKLQKLIKNQ